MAVSHCHTFWIWSRFSSHYQTIMRGLAYRLHKMELLSLFPPPVQGSRSIWQSGISLRSCSCCSIGVRQLPRRFLLSHELEAKTQTMVWKNVTAFSNTFWRFLNTVTHSNYEYHDSIALWFVSRSLFCTNAIFFNKKRTFAFVYFRTFKLKLLIKQTISSSNSAIII